MLRHLEHQLVVNLQQHARRFEPGTLQRRAHPDHGAAQDVGGAALDRRVDRCALKVAAHTGIPRVDLRIMNPAAEDRLHEPHVMRALLGRVHVVADAGEALEIGLDVGAGLLARDAELIGEPERGDPVDDAEVDGFGAPAHLGRHALDRHAEHFRRRHGMNVEPVREGTFELRNIGNVRKNAQLDLRVVGRNEHVSRIGDEGGADLAAFLGADRNVLQVGVGRGQPSRRRRGERITRVNAPGLAMDERGQRIGIGR